MDVVVGEEIFGKPNDFATRDAFAVALVGEGGPVIASGNDDAAPLQSWLGDFLPKLIAGGGEKQNIGKRLKVIAAS